MNSYTGVAKILRFNWPWYATSGLVTIGALAMLTLVHLEEMTQWLIIMTLGLANMWLMMSLVVSHMVYDRSPLAHGCWVPENDVNNVVILHAGHDEASSHVYRRLPDVTCHVFDIGGSGRRMSPSLRRARMESASVPVACDPGKIPLPDGSIDLVVMVFAAHEFREAAERLRLFREIARVIGVHGRALVLEHQRDVWNFLAYGPGCFHFLSRTTWIDTFTQANLRVVRDDVYTPWVHSFELRSSA